MIDVGLEISRSQPTTGNNDPFYNSATESFYIDFQGHSIETNTTNGDIYVVGRSTNQPQLSDRVGLVSIYATNSTLVKEIRGLSFSEIPRGIAYNSTNDSMYVGGTLHDIGGSSYTSSTIYVFDGSTREISSTLDVSTYSTSSINKIVSYEDEIIVSFGDTILNIDSSNNITIGLTSSNDIKHATKAEDIYLYGDTNNDVFYDKLVSFTNQIYSPTASTDNVHTLQDKSGTIAHTDDIPPTTSPWPTVEKQTSKTIWVDKTYGNNTTAIPYDETKPYSTVSAALTAAVSGDLVYVRPGTYTETITLKNGVNVWCDKGVTVGSTSGAYGFGNGGTTMVCSWLGYAVINTGYRNSGMSFTSTSSRICIECEEITNAGSMIVFDAIDSEVDIKCKNIYGSLFNGIFYRPKNNSTMNFTVTGYCRAAGGQWGTTLTSPWRMFIPDDATPFTGTFNVNIKKLIISESTTNSVYQLFSTRGAASAGTFNFNIEEVENRNTTQNQIFIQNNGLTKCSVNINQPFTLNKSRFIILNGSAAGEINFTGEVRVEEQRPIDISNSNGRLTISNSKIIRGTASGDVNNIIQQTSNGHYLKVENTLLHKESLGTSTDSLVTLSGASSNNFFINSNVIISGGTTSTIAAFDAADVSNGNVYFINTRSNRDNSVNITDVAPISGFIGNDTYIINIL